MSGCFTLGWNPIKSLIMGLLALSSCWSETCDWQTKIFSLLVLLKDNKETKLLQDKHRLVGK